MGEDKRGHIPDTEKSMSRARPGNTKPLQRVKVQEGTRKKGALEREVGPWRGELWGSLG